MIGYAFLFLVCGLVLSLTLSHHFLWLFLAGAIGIGIGFLGLLIYGLRGKFRSGWPLA
jgi:hypothetical protein